MKSLVPPPSCLNSAIRKLVNQYSDDPEFINKALKSFFVDDFISEGKGVEKAFELFIKLRNRFKEGHFNLRKWKTNSAHSNDLIYNANIPFFINNQKFKQSPQNLKFFKQFAGVNKSRKLNNPLQEQAKTFFLHRKPKRNAHFWTCQFRSVH